MENARIDTRTLAAQLVATRPTLDEEQQRIAIALYRLLAEARPVSRAQLAEHARAARETVGRLLDEQAGVYVDHLGRVIGFWGMALG